MKPIKPGEIWFAYFPYIQDPTQGKHRPVLVLRASPNEIFAIEITSHTPRDSYDIPLQQWHEANLDKPSTARASHSFFIPTAQFVHKIGNLNVEDIITIQNTYFRYIRQRQYEQSKSDPRKSYLFQKSKHSTITTDVDIRIARVLLKQGHHFNDTVKAINKHSPNAPPLSNESYAYSKKVTRLAERQLKAEQIKSNTIALTL